MFESRSSFDDWDNFHHTLAAELTDAAYPVALRFKVGDEWLDLELDLWKVLSETVRKWEQQVPHTGSPDEFHDWREGLLVALTERTLDVAARHGMKTPLSEVEFDFYQVFHLVLREITCLQWSRSVGTLSKELQPVGHVLNQ
jgi:hypothetical protein